MTECVAHCAENICGQALYAVLKPIYPLGVGQRSQSVRSPVYGAQNALLTVFKSMHEKIRNWGTNREESGRF